VRSGFEEGKHGITQRLQDKIWYKVVLRAMPAQYRPKMHSLPKYTVLNIMMILRDETLNPSANAIMLKLPRPALLQLLIFQRSLQLSSDVTGTSVERCPPRSVFETQRFVLSVAPSKEA